MKLDDDRVVLTDEKWLERLGPERFDVLRKKGTERAFAGKLNFNKEKGRYLCAGCGQELFASKAKFDSGTGWPSFWEPADDDAIETHRDLSYGMMRTEVICSRCGGHLGHVFSDGPEPTGLRYCINSVSLEFEKAENEQ